MVLVALGSLARVLSNASLFKKSPPINTPKQKEIDIVQCVCVDEEKKNMTRQKCYFIVVVIVSFITYKGVSERETEPTHKN